MLGGDHADPGPTRFSSPCAVTPVLRYGEEIGMGDDLSLPGP